MTTPTRIEQSRMFAGQQDILSPEDLVGLDIEIIGAGSLGGSILICLTKMGFGITNRVRVTDFDRCEMHNLPTQWFREADVHFEQDKVEAVADLCEWITDRRIDAIRDRFTGLEERVLGPVVILAIDSLEERRRIWNNLRTRKDVRLVIDARVGSEVTDIYCVDPQGSELEEYEASLEGEPLDESCARHGILFTVLGAAAFVGSILRAFAKNEDYPRHLAFDFRNFLVASAP